MAKMFHGSVRMVLLAALLAPVIAGGIGYGVWKHSHAQPAVQPPVVVAATKPALPIAPKRPSAPKFDGSYLHVVRAAYPDFPTTQPLGVPLELSQAAHLKLDDPIYLGGVPRAEMWITRADAPPVDQVLKDAVDENKDEDVHVLREHVDYVYWMPTEVGIWPPYLVCRRDDGRHDVVSYAHGRQPLPAERGYHWEHTIPWNSKLVVPTEHGVSVFEFGSQIREAYHELAPPGSASQPAGGFAEPRVLLDWQGLIAWIPWEAGKTGGRGAARYVEPAGDSLTAARTPGKWTDLSPDNGWPEKILHLVPLLDGTVLMLTVDGQGAVQIQFNTLERAPVKEADIAKLVDELSDTDQVVRNAAYDKLSQYGSGIWPILEKMMEDQGPEAQTRMRQLLKQKATPTLNGMALLGHKGLKLAARLADGGTIFYAEAGVSIPNPDNPDAGPDYRVPAWISIRPGHAIELLPEVFTSDLTQGQSSIYANGSDLVITGDLHGARRFVGNGFVPLLRKSEQEFSDFLGIDRRGRWFFRKPIAAGSATAPSTDVTTTLIIDPSLPDPTPRLPVWIFRTAESVGWTRAGWPVAKNVSAFALHENDWVLVDEKETIYTKMEEMPQAPAGPATLPTTRPSAPAATFPATNAAVTESSEKPILVDGDGNQYFGGLTDLRVISKSGVEVSWNLPAIANGEGPPWLVRTSDGRLFLFNQSGRVVRIKPTPDGVEPFAMEKVFTHHIPPIAHPTRVWLDPAGRIIMAWENQLAIMFPSGYIPRAIGEKIPAADASGDEDE